ncbi:MAG TPA: hypothetical protein VN698_13000 [Bacteroidia bacterium]|nr:hypothetical protein [Bacteroidia bacterium]
MKNKIIAIVVCVLILSACGHKNSITDLKLNADRPADVESKFGKPDSVDRKVFLGISAEYWLYKKDSIALLFRNDILADAAYLRDIEAIKKHRVDSLFEIEKNRQDSVMQAIENDPVEMERIAKEADAAARASEKQ